MPAFLASFEVINAQETALLLRIKLGDSRHWVDFLADCIRGKTSLNGLTLEPYGYVRNRCKRPMYLKSDVLDFINKALLILSPPSSPLRLHVKTMLANPAPMPWRLRELHS